MQISLVELRLMNLTPEVLQMTNEWLNFHASGPEIITATWLVDSKQVSRTWRERLFSWPWRPWVKTKIIQMPSTKIYFMEGNKIVCHPAIEKELREKLS